MRILKSKLEIELDYKQLSWTVQEQPFTVIHFRKFLQKKIGGRVLLLVKLQTDCSEWRLYTKMTPPSSEAAVHCHPFSKISPEYTGGKLLLLVKLQIGCSG